MLKLAAEAQIRTLEKTLGEAGACAAIVAATGSQGRRPVVAGSAAEQMPGSDTAALIAGQLRLTLAERLNLVPQDRWEFLWLRDFLV